MNSIDAALAIAKKDLRVALRDRAGVALSFGLPVVLVLAFGFIYEMTMGQPGGMARSSLWLADFDDTERSRRFVEALRANTMLTVKPAPDAARLDAAELERKVRDGEAHHALLVEKGFGRALEAGDLPPLRLFRDPGREMESQLVSIALLQSMMTVGGHELAPALTTRALVKVGLPEDYADRMLSIARGFSTTIGALFLEAGIDPSTLGGDSPANGAAPPAGDATAAADPPGPGLDANELFGDLLPIERVDLPPPQKPRSLTYMLSHNLAGNAQMMLMFGLVACATLLLQERDSGTLRRLLVAPMPARAHLLGKLFFMAAIGAMQLSLLYLVASLVFGVNVMRDPLTLVVLSLVLIFAVTAFGLLIATLARTATQAEGISTLIILLMSALGGAWFPLDQFDLPLAGTIVKQCTLTHWAMHAFQGMLYHGRDLTHPTLLLDLGVLVGFGLVALAIANRAFRTRFAS